jgi:hypothetical protein
VTEQPYLSVVASTRNDDHGGNPLYRTQLFVNGLLAQCDRHKVPAELILVEWNPPADRPRMAQALTWPETEGWCDVRIIEVPHEAHRRLEHSDRLPLFQMIAKNVAIRRARGEFVAATNIDILLSDELMEFIAARKLRHGRMYRVDRYDVPAEIDPDWDMAAQLRFCRESAIRINRREGTLELRTGRYFGIYPMHTPSAWLRNTRRGRRVAASRLGRMLGLQRLATPSARPDGPVGRVWNSDLAARARRTGVVRGVWTTTRIVRFICWRIYAFFYWLIAGFNDPRKVPDRVRRRLRRPVAALAASEVATTDGAAADDGAQAEGGGPAPASGPVGGLAGACAALVRRKIRSLHEMWEIEQARIRLHTNASGDFTLLARDDWERTGGYAEFEMYSMHIDGLLLYSGHYLGLHEQYLPFPTYHIEHGGGFRPEVEGSEALYTILEERAIPKTSDEQLMGYIREMYRTGRPIEFNRPDWGFVGETFPETDPLARVEEMV